MTTAEAIRSLRGRLGLKPLDLARELKIGVGSVYRYENGDEPKAKVLLKLALFAQQNELDHLWDFFSAVRRATIRENIWKLPSRNSERRIPAIDLKQWVLQESTLEAVRNAAEGKPDPVALFKALDDLERRQRDITLYLCAPESQPHSLKELSQCAREYITNRDPKAEAARTNAFAKEANERHREFWRKRQ